MPNRTKTSPSRIERFPPSTGERSPNFFLRLRISTPATAAMCPPPGFARVGGGIRRLCQAHRRGVDDAVRILRHLEGLHHLGRRRGGGRRARTTVAAAHE